MEKFEPIKKQNCKLLLKNLINIQEKLVSVYSIWIATKTNIHSLKYDQMNQNLSSEHLIQYQYNPMINLISFGWLVRL